MTIEQFEQTMRTIETSASLIEKLQNVRECVYSLQQAIRDVRDTVDGKYTVDTKYTLERIPVIHVDIAETDEEFHIVHCSDVLDSIYTITDTMEHMYRRKIDKHYIALASELTADN